MNVNPVATPKLPPPPPRAGPVEVAVPVAGVARRARPSAVTIVSAAMLSQVARARARPGRCRRPGASPPMPTVGHEPAGTVSARRASAEYTSIRRAPAPTCTVRRSADTAMPLRPERSTTRPAVGRGVARVAVAAGAGDHPHVVARAPATAARTSAAPVALSTASGRRCVVARVDHAPRGGVAGAAGAQQRRRRSAGRARTGAAAAPRAGGRPRRARPTPAASAAPRRSSSRG